jgi:tripartite-type tricarboxylate transporter receptor subunit TctC
VQVPNVLAVHPSLPVRNAKELVALAKARPGQLTYGSAGTGTSNHLSGELLKYMAGVNIVHVPYKGSPQSLIDAIRGEVSMVFAPMLTARPHFTSGKLKALGVTTPARSAAAPEIPTIAESGVPGYDAKAWFGVLAPAGTPRELVTRLNGELISILGQTDVRESLKNQGADAVAPNSPEDFGAYIKAEIAKWAKVIKASGAKAD